MGFNKGEWSELYTFLYLIENPKLAIVDENLKLLDDNIFKIIELILNSKTRYKIIDDKKILKISSNVLKEYLIESISINKTLLLNKILEHTKAKGSFEIEEIQPLINDLFDGKKLKGSSKVKGDLWAKVFDKKRDDDFELKYNIKSNLGSSATLLNASNHTNFIFKVEYIDDNIMNSSNLINTRTKLIDKYNFLNSKGAKFSFIKIESEIFSNNLKLIDSNLDKLLAKMLILSYENNEKDIKKLLSIIISDEASEIYYKKKIADFTNAVTFGMRASEKWNGENEVNGGIIVVTKNGNICLLDLIYFKKVVDKYLIDNVKFDSPSSRRYKMFEIYKEKNKYYFKLNLQIRFK